jgi:hypothetical protein
MRRRPNRPPDGYEMRIAAIVSITGALVLAAAYVWFCAPTRERVRRSGASAHDQRHPAAAASFITGAAVAAVPSNSTPLVNFKTLFAESGNYWDLAHRILADAKKGNPDAQFYLWRILHECSDASSAYFHEDGRTLSLNGALRRADRLLLPQVRVRFFYDRCHDFLDMDSTELGDAAMWLAAATTAGQPLAQATTAMQIAMQEVVTPPARAHSGPAADSSGAPVKTDSLSYHQLLRLAVESRDPEVLFDIGDMQFMLNPNNPEHDIDRYAWMLIACESGFDCTSNAGWVQNGCLPRIDCEGMTGPTDYIRHLAGDEWQAVEQRSGEIRMKLDAGQWGDLGLGP